MNLRRMMRLWTLLAAVWTWTAVGGDPFLWSWKTDGDRLQVECQVAAKHYLYADFVTVRAEAGGREATLPNPTGVRHDDPEFGVTTVFDGGRVWRWQYALKAPLARLTVRYQGCAEPAEGQPGVCFAPKKITLFPATAAEKTSEKKPETARDELRFDGFETVAAVSGTLDSKQMIALIEKGGKPGAATPDEATHGTGFWALFALVLLGGLGLNLTPCVLPMIPVNLAIIGAGADGGGSRWRGLRRGAAYGLGITMAYGSLGVLAALTGSRFGAINSSMWFNAMIAVIFAGLGIALAGGFNLDFSRYSDRLATGATRRFPPEISAFLLGAIAALLAGACVAPVVISVVVLAAGLYSKGAYWGILLPFALGLAMALPWPLAGAGMAVLPKPGPWMAKVKLLMAAVIFIAAGYFAYLAWGLRPGHYDAAAEFARLDNALATARAEKKPILIDFWATWCKNCRAMEKTVFTDPGVQAALTKVEMIRFQAENLNDPAVKALLDRWKLAGLPAFVLLRPER